MEQSYHHVIDEQLRLKGYSSPYCFQYKNRAILKNQTETSMLAKIVFNAI